MNARFLYLLAPAAGLLASCNTNAPPSGFLGNDDALLKANANLPFQRSWKSPEADFCRYHEIAVAPMLTDRLKSLGSGLDAVSFRNFGDSHRKDCEAFAAYATSEFQQKIDSSATLTAHVAAHEPKKKGVLLLETNLVEAVPGHPSAQIANFFIPFTGLLNRPSVAIEGRVRDAESGKTLFVFADRETPEISLLDARKFTFYGAQEREATRWAGQIRQILEGKDKRPIKDPFFIQPVNW